MANDKGHDAAPPAPTDRHFALHASNAGTDWICPACGPISKEDDETL